MKPRWMRSEKGIVQEANRLAREFYALMGYTVLEGYRFDRATHPTERAVWVMACIAMERLTGTDVENALAELDD